MIGGNNSKSSITARGGGKLPIEILSTYQYSEVGYLAGYYSYHYWVDSDYRTDIELGLTEPDMDNDNNGDD